jgi:hypothetical protein
MQSMNTLLNVITIALIMINNYDKIKMSLYLATDGACEVCGKLTNFNDGQLAHKIAKSKWALKKYGSEVIDSRENLAFVCSLHCNSAVLVTADLQIENLVNRIKNGKV